MYKLLLAAVLSLVTVNASASVITFNDLPGRSRDPFLPYQEAGFLVTPLTGRWLEGLDASALGNPLPDIFGDTYTATLQVTNLSGSPFSFTSIDLESGTIYTLIEYTLEGTLAGIPVFSTTGNAPYPFITVNSPSSGMIDKLMLSMVRLDAEGYEVDNIRLNAQAAVPEPASVLIWGALGLGMVLCHFRQKGKSLMPRSCQARTE